MIWWMTLKLDSCRTCKIIDLKWWMELESVAITTMVFSKTISSCQRQVQMLAVWSRRSIIANSQRLEWGARPDHQVEVWEQFQLISITIRIIVATVRSVRSKEWRCIYEQRKKAIIRPLIFWWTDWRTESIHNLNIRESEINTISREPHTIHPINWIKQQTLFFDLN